MSTPQLLTDTLLEGTTGLYSFVLVDENGVAIDPIFLTTLTLTLYDADSLTIVNGRNHQDIHNVNGGSVTTMPGPPATTTVTFVILPADTVIFNEQRRVEYRVLHFRWTWTSNTPGNTAAHVVQFGIENVDLFP